MDSGLDLPIRVLIIPVSTGSDFPAHTMASKYHTSKYKIWHLMCDRDLPPKQIERVLGLLLLDESERVLHTGLMPYHPPSAHFLKTGEIRSGRGLGLAPWVYEETDRLARLLSEQHSEYATDFAAALKEAPSKNFRPLQPGEVFADTVKGAQLGVPPSAIGIDLTRSERHRFGLDHYQVLAQDYARNRFLMHESRAALGRRQEDIVANIHVLSENGLISLDAKDPVLRYWFAKMTEVQVEMMLRHGQQATEWKRGFIDLSRLPASVAAAGPAAAVDLVSRHPSDIALVKYGKRAYMEGMIMEGMVRVSPATAYTDSSLNEAVRDNELATEIKYAIAGPLSDDPLGLSILPVGRAILRGTLTTNYYVYCVSEYLSRRLLFDFDADACVVVYDQEEFIRRIQAAMEEVCPGWHCDVDYVTYYDPLMVRPDEIKPPMAKHFRFAYQKEMRLAWLPPDKAATLPHVDLKIGSIEDIAELVLPRPSRSG